MNVDLKLVVEVVRLASGLILANGGETYRAEETAERIGSAFGCHMDIIAFPTGLTMTLSDGTESVSSIVRVNRRTTDLTKLEQVNAISRALAAHTLEPEAALTRLRAIKERKAPEGWRSVLAAGGTAAMFALMFGGGLVDFAAAGIIGACVQCVLLFLPDQDGMPLSCLVGGIETAALTLLAVSLWQSGDLNRIIWSVMMPLLPGLAFTNGIRDSMNGDMVSGGARISDAVMRAVVLAAGAGVVLWVYTRLGGVITWLS